MMGEPRRPPPIEVEFPDLARWEEGNTGIPYAWRFQAERPGPRVTIQALTHGNEVCGAISNDWLLSENLRPVRGTLTLTFANVQAYRSFDPSTPFASRCVEEDFNRLWTAEVLDGDRRSADLARARALRPLYEDTDYLLDLHSMTEPCPPLALAGRQQKGLELAQAIGVPEHIVIDAGHVAGKRLRDYAAFDDPVDPRNALLIECGQHWERAAPEMAKQASLRFLRHFGMADPAFLEAHLTAALPPAQRAIQITDVVTIATDEFAFARPVKGLDVIARGGTLLARDGTREVHTPYDDAVLIMPTRDPRKGETAVRIGRFVA
ncbi:MAG: succinylglutamate desuccinylase/aspartoacylase family protein [Burkholderiales bacterium]|nr:succinylglutamate desuccinylase/aspartoacylase family protein [Burkholderiales bacterium]